MSRRVLCLAGVLLLGTMGSQAGGGSSIALPPHPERLGVDLGTALAQRRSTREFSPRELSPADLSALLWAGNGVNRPDGKRTAPSAHGEQYMELYVVSGSGAWRYDARGNRLERVREGNFKARLSDQPQVGRAPQVLVLVADLAKLHGPAAEKETHRAWAHATAGTIAQNVALMAAAKGIGTCLVGGINRQAISEVLGLSGEQEPLYVMPLGYEP